MGEDMMKLLAVCGIVIGSITLFVLLVRFIVVPVFKGVGSGIGMFFQGVGWTFMHLFEFIGGMCSDIVRLIGALLAMCVLIPLVPLNIIIGRWSAAGHFSQSVRNECVVGAKCLYRVVLRRPLKLVLLHGLLEGLEQRVPEAMAAAPSADSPGRRIGQFDGYSIIGSMRSGGSGAKLYIAQPNADARRRHPGMPDRVVIKAFVIEEGSSLPQIVRESRALECARQLGHVLDHGMDDHRFFYVMPYHAGDHLGIVARQLHGESDGTGLRGRALANVTSWAADLLHTLSSYHRGGLWHKDVKPENVIIHDGRAHLVDLGLVTSLHSPMTLTTHGTEYFRDPEMVRQALRGVKVHQVDGAKFDVYAVGAVLYFMMENTFPAHGGLSRFALSSPESLRWIVRRAMTEYSQRYATADEMLADVQAVLAAADPFAVRPAQLPSMRGGQDRATPQYAIDLTTDREVVGVAGARSPVAGSFSDSSGSLGGYGIAAGIGAAGAFAQVGRFNLDAEGNPIPQPHAQGSMGWFGRPRLALTNWWTGSYRVHPAGSAGVSQPPYAGASPHAVHDQAKDFRRQAVAFRQQADGFRQQVRAGAMSARKAAREQIKAARQRATEIRSRAQARRHRAVGRGGVSAGVVVIGLISIAAIFLGTMFMTFSQRSVSHDAPSRAAASVAIVTNEDSGPRTIIVFDPKLAGEASLTPYVHRVADSGRNKGQEMVTPAPENDRIASLVEQWQKDQNGPADAAIEQYLEANHAFSIAYVWRGEDRRRGIDGLSRLEITSSDPSARDRRVPAIDPQLAAIPAAPADARPLLLINDHPAKTDPKVESMVTRQLRVYKDKGWVIVMDDQVEAAVRKDLPLGSAAQSQTPPLSFAACRVLVRAGMGGVLRVDAGPGNGPPNERVLIVPIRPDAGMLTEALRLDASVADIVTEQPTGSMAPVVDE